MKSKLKKQLSIPLPPILFKIGPKKWLENLINKGDVYFGEFKTYRDDNSPDYQERLLHSVYGRENYRPELNFYRNDPLECAASIAFSDDNQISVKYHQKHTHALSLFGFSHQLPLDFKISKQMKNFGDHFAIFNSRVFLKALVPKLEKVYLGEFPDFGYVEYYEITPSRSIEGLTPFHKKKYYDYQCEYRITANLKDNIINIGDVLSSQNDSMILPIEKLEEIELFIE